MIMEDIISIAIVAIILLIVAPIANKVGEDINDYLNKHFPNVEE